MGESSSDAKGIYSVGENQPLFSRVLLEAGNPFDVNVDFTPSQGFFAPHDAQNDIGL
jgi:hypothetical protein